MRCCLNHKYLKSRGRIDQCVLTRCCQSHRCLKNRDRQFGRRCYHCRRCRYLKSRSYQTRCCRNRRYQRNRVHQCVLMRYCQSRKCLMNQDHQCVRMKYYRSHKYLKNRVHQSGQRYYRCRSYRWYHCLRILLIFRYVLRNRMNRHLRSDLTVQCGPRNRSCRHLLGLIDLCVLMSRSCHHHQDLIGQCGLSCHSCRYCQRTREIEVSSLFSQMRGRRERSAGEQNWIVCFMESTFHTEKRCSEDMNP